MESLRELFLTLGLDADEASFASAISTVDALEKMLELAAEAAVKLGEALVETVIGATEYADKIGDASTVTGVGVEQLQAFEYAAVQSGSSLEGVVAGLTILNRNMYAAAHGSAEMAANFSRLGVRVTEVDGSLRDPAEAMKDLATAIQKLPPGAAKGANAMDILGKSGRDLVPFLAEGREGLEQLEATARSFGGIIPAEELQRAKDFADAWAGMAWIFQNVRNELGLMLIKDLKPMLESFRDWYGVNRELIKSKLKDFIDGVRVAIRGFDAAMKKATHVLELFIVAVKVAAVVVDS